MNTAQKLRLKLVAGSFAVVGSVGSAFASGEAAVFTAISDKVTELEGYAWPVIGVVTIAMVSIGLFKKFANKSAK